MPSWERRCGPSGRERFVALVELHQNRVGVAVVAVTHSIRSRASFSADIDLAVEADAGVGNIVRAHVDGGAFADLQPVSAIQEEVQKQAVLRVLSGAAGNRIVSQLIKRIYKIDVRG